MLFLITKYKDKKYLIRQRLFDISNSNLKSILKRTDLCLHSRGVNLEFNLNFEV